MWPVVLESVKMSAQINRLLSDIINFNLFSLRGLKVVGGSCRSLASKSAGRGAKLETVHQNSFQNTTNKQSLVAFVGSFSLLMACVVCEATLRRLE